MAMKRQVLEVSKPRFGPIDGSKHQVLWTTTFSVKDKVRERGVPKVMAARVEISGGPTEAEIVFGIKIFSKKSFQNYKRCYEQGACVVIQMQYGKWTLQLLLRGIKEGYHVKAAATTDISSERPLFLVSVDREYELQLRVLHGPDEGCPVMAKLGNLFISKEQGLDIKGFGKEVELSDQACNDSFFSQVVQQKKRKAYDKKDDCSWMARKKKKDEDGLWVAAESKANECLHSKKGPFPRQLQDRNACKKKKKKKRDKVGDPFAKKEFEAPQNWLNDDFFIGEEEFKQILNQMKLPEEEFDAPQNLPNGDIFRGKEEFQQMQLSEDL